MSQFLSDLINFFLGDGGENLAVFYFKLCVFLIVFLGAIFVLGEKRTSFLYLKVIAVLCWGVALGGAAMCVWYYHGIKHTIRMGDSFQAAIFQKMGLAMLALFFLPCIVRLFQKKPLVAAVPRRRR